MNIQRAGIIGAMKSIVFTAKMVTINNALFYQKIVPGVIAVTAQQGVVQIENGQRQGEGSRQRQGSVCLISLLQRWPRFNMRVQQLDCLRAAY